jgi:hypothetical protein
MGAKTEDTHRGDDAAVTSTPASNAVQRLTCLRPGDRLSARGSRSTTRCRTAP